MDTPQLILFVRTNKHAFIKWVKTQANEPSVNSKAAWGVTPTMAAVDREFVCSECHVSFASRQARAVHCLKAHAQSECVSRYLDGSHCFFCMQDFGSRFAATAHLDKSVRCRIATITMLDPLPQGEVDRLNAKEAQRMRHIRSQGLTRWHSASGTLRLEGPLSLAAHKLGLSHKSLLRTGERVDPEEIMKLWAKIGSEVT